MKKAFVRKRVAFHKSKTNILLLLGLILFPFHLSAQSRAPISSGSIEVQRNSAYYGFTPEELVQNIFVKKGGCASVSNVTYKGHGWNGSSWTSESRGLGYFHKGSSVFTMEEGLILTTGQINTLEGPNSRGDGCLPIDPKVKTTDADLQSLLGSGSGITNVAVLEFDFVPSTNRVTFRYRFGSEEYPEFAGTTWNDVFGFFISGPGIPSGKQNIALLPDNTSVSINNVNDGNRPYSRQNCRRPDNFDEYIATPKKAPKNRNMYVRVPGGWSTVACDTTVTMLGNVAVATYKATELNGLTVTLEATAEVVPCQTYHIKLAIGNVHRTESLTSDFEKQSAVFLEANSFDIGAQVTNYGNGIENMDLLYRGCDNNYFRFSRANTDNSELSLAFTYEGTAINGVDITTLDGQPLPSIITIPANQLYTDVFYKVPNTSSGAKYLDLDIVLNCPCNEDKVKKRLWIYDSTPEEDYDVRAISSCIGTNNNKIRASATGGSGHHQASLDGQAWYSLPYTFENLAAGDHAVYLRDSIGCHQYVRGVKAGDLIIDIGQDQTSCSNTFTMDAPVLNSGESGIWVVKSGTATITNENDPKTTVTVTSESAVLKWTLTTPDCTFEGETTLTVASPKLTSPPRNAEVCSGSKFTYNAETDIPVSSISWVRAEVEGVTNPEATGNTAQIDERLNLDPAIDVTKTVVYRITFTANGCTTVEDVAVKVKPMPTITSSKTPDAICTGSRFEYEVKTNMKTPTISWRRDAVDGIQEPESTGTTEIINEVLTNTGVDPKTVVYKVTVTVGGCRSTENVLVMVDTKPTLSNTLTPDPICSDEEFGYPLESDVAGAVFTWERQPMENIEPVPDGSSIGKGTGAIREALINTGTDTKTVKYKITVATSTGCVNPTEYELEVDVKPQAKWSNPPDTPLCICSGATFGYTPESNPTGGTISWERQPNDKVEPAPSGSSTGAISEQLINTSSDPVDVIYKLTFTSTEGCANPVTSDLVVTVNPIPAITSPLTHEMCSGSQVGYEIKTNVQNATFSWKREAVAGIEEPESTGTSNVINEVLTYVGTGNDQKPQDAVYEVTITSAGCVTTQNVTVKVKPLPRVFVYGGVRESFCSGKSFEITPRSSVYATTRYEWKMPAVEHIEGGERNGSGNVRLTLTNTSTEKVPVSFFYTGTADGCVGPTWECKTAIDPYPNVSNPIDDFGLVCSGSKIFYEPDIDVEGAVFSWSRSSVPGLYQPSQSGKGKIDESLGNLSDTLIDVTYLCNIEARSCSLPLTKINVTLYPSRLKISNRPQSSIYICSNSIFHFEPLVKPADATVTVTREPIEGITATRIGDYDAAIINDLLVNKTNKDIKVTYTYKLESSLCPSANTTEAVIVTVEGAPQITNIEKAPKLHCSGTEYTFNPTYDYINGSTVTIEWERQPNAHIEGSSSGSGLRSIREILTNKTNAPVQVSYKMKISRSGCADDYTYYDINVTVYPEPKWTQPSTLLSICSGETFNFDPLKDLAPEFAGATATWERKPIDGIEPAPSATGSGSINEQLTNTGTISAEVTYLLTFTSDMGCKNITPYELKVTVNPQSTWSNPPATPLSICSGSTFNYTPQSSITGSTISWERQAAANIEPAPGASSTSAISEQLTNTGTTPIEVTYRLTFTSSDGCTNPQTSELKVIVKPMPSWSNIPASPLSICSGSTFSYTPESSVSGTTISWIRQPVANIEPAPSAGSTDAISEQLVNTGTTPVEVTYKLAFTNSNGCTNPTTSELKVTVNPQSSWSNAPTMPMSICSGSTFSYTPQTDIMGSTIAWERQPIANIEPAPSGSSTGSINEKLTTTGKIPVEVIYKFTLTSSDGCINPIVSELKVTVNPLPTLINNATTFEIFSGENFTYAAKSDMSGVSFNWERNLVSGIANPASTGNTADVDEKLENETGDPKEVVYKFTLKTAECENIEYVKVIVKSKVTLSSTLTPSPICSGDDFNYTATCDISGVKFSWERIAIEGINGNTGNRGSSHLVDEKLENTKDTPITVIYRFKLEIGASVNYEDVKVVVKPKPILSSSKSPAGICSGYEFNYIATTNTYLGSIAGWKRDAIEGISNAGATGTGFAIKETLVNTTSSPIEVTYVFSLEADGCVNEEQVKVLVTVQPLISIKDAKANEGDDLEFEVILSGAGCTGGNATVDYVTVDGTAKSPDDYTFISGILTFGPGETSKKIIVHTEPDNILEGKETMIVRLSSPTFSQLEGASPTLDALGTIEDRTDGAIMVEKYEPEPGDTPASEPSTDGSFRIRFKDKNVTCTKDVRIEFALSGADLGKDYTIDTNSIVKDSEAIIKAGKNDVVIPIKIIDNNIVQGDRKLTLKLIKVELIEP